MSVRSGTNVSSFRLYPNVAGPPPVAHL